MPAVAPTALLPPDAPDRDRMGGKGAALARLVEAGFRVPPFVVVPGDVPDAALDAALAALPMEGERFAVRSSGASEDGAAASFAGMFETFLGVAPADVAARVRDVRASAESETVQAYAASRGVAAPGPPAVVVQAMVGAEAAGVAFSADPVTGTRGESVLAAVHGLGSVLVDGRAEGETLRVRGGAVAERRWGGQAEVDALADGLATHHFDTTPPVLSDAQALAVAELAAQAEAAFGAPQDIEWALDEAGALWMLQSRPITTLAPPEGEAPEEEPPVQRPAVVAGPPASLPSGRSAVPLDLGGQFPSVDERTGGPERAPTQRTLVTDASSDRPMRESAASSTPGAAPVLAEVRPGRVRLWDNSNIVESYGGVVSPLTFSFARRSYAAVYRLFCETLGVPRRTIEAERDVFEQMLGSRRGRVYYNLASWYRVLAMLPGYRLNAELMEGMMGVREGIPPELRPAPPTGGKLRDAFALVGSLLGLVRSAIRLPRMKRDFAARLDRSLAPAGPGSGRGLDAMSLDALAGLVRQMERDLLFRWDAPLVNDFFAMIAFGLANRAADAWIGPGALGHLLAGDGAIVSAEPVRRTREIARLTPPALVAALADRDADPAAALAAHPEVRAAVDRYVADFGDRCLEELKLESPTLADDPRPLFDAVVAHATGPARTGAPGELRVRAEAEARAALRRRPLRRAAFGVLLRLARARVRDRENLRFERTRVFGRARRIFLAMGARLAEAGRLDAPRDVFYLEVPELLGAAEGTLTTDDLAGLARVRRERMAAFAAAPAPPERFLTDGAAALAPITPDEPPAAELPAGETRTGVGCCAGVVEGPVRVVRDPRGVALAPGTVLVAERTDPGWVLLFPSCAGLVVQRGSLLSHSAIVARELGIPAAVSVPGATRWLADGDRVRLDGATGRVERLAPADD